MYSVEWWLKYDAGTIWQDSGTIDNGSECTATMECGFATHSNLIKRTTQREIIIMGSRVGFMTMLTSDHYCLHYVSQVKEVEQEQEPAQQMNGPSGDSTDAFCMH